MDDKDIGIIDLFGQLVERFTFHQKAYLGQPQLSLHQKKRNLKRRLFDTLFSNLTGPHSYGVHSDGISKKYGCQEAEDILGTIFELRTSGQIDRANQLQYLIDEFQKDGIQDEKGRILRVILQLSFSTPDEEYCQLNIIGRKVFKPPIVFTNNNLPRLLPPGPRIYGDSRLPNESHQFFTHFPEEVFKTTGTEPTLQTSLQKLEYNLLTQRPGCGLPFIFQADDQNKEAYGRKNQMSLFGALVQNHSLSLTTRLELPSLSDNSEFNGIRVPKLAESPLDEGYESSTLTTTPSVESLSIDSGRATFIDEILDEALKTKPVKYLAWETVGRPKFEKEKPYLTEAGSLAFDEMYRHRCETLQLLDSATLLPSEKKLSMKELVFDALNLLIAVPSYTFEFNIDTDAFDLKRGVTLSGLSMTSVRQACKPILECATHYIRLESFARPIDISSHHYKGLVFQAFSEGIRHYLQYYRGYILSLSNELTLLQLTFTISTVAEQVRFLAELCGCAMNPRSQPAALNDGQFPTGVALLSYLYEACMDSANFHHYPMLLSLLNTTAKPFIVFLSEWVFYGIHRDLYGEFFIRVDLDYLYARDESYWTGGYRLTKEAVKLLSGKSEPGAAPCVPLFLRDLVNEIYVCGKSINLLRAMAPQHFLLTRDQDLPRVRIMYSEEDLSAMALTCTAYRARMQAIARQLTFTKEQMKERAETARRELILQARRTATEHMKKAMEKKKAAREKENVRKRALLDDLKSQMIADVKRKAAAQEAEKEEDVERMEYVNRQELVESRVGEELERQAREEIVSYYEKLSEEATRREQKALWLVQRRRLAAERAEFLQQDEQRFLQELEDNPIYEDDEDRVDALSVESPSIDNLPGWAQRGLDKAGAAFGLDPAPSDKLPKWAQTESEPKILATVDEDEEIPTKEKEKSHPSQSTIQDVLKMSDNQSNDQANKPEVVFATDVPHVSQTSKQGLLRLDGVSDDMRKDTSKSDFVTIKDLKAAQDLHVKHTGENITQPKQHPSASVIQNFMYSNSEQQKDIQSGQTITIDDSNVAPVIDIEAEVQKRLKEKIAQHIKTPSVKREAKTHVKISSTINATTESHTEDTFKPTIKTRESSGAHVESQSTDTFKPHIRSVMGQSATSESTETETEKPHIKVTLGKGATVESTEEIKDRKIKKTVSGIHVNEESTEEMQQFHLKVNPDKHANRESSPKKIKIFKPSIFGHVSQLSQMAEYDILAPKLKKTMQNYSNKESDWRTYQVKSCRRKVKDREVNKQSDEVDAPKAQVKNTADKHVSQESEFVNIDALRVEKFRQRNKHLRSAADSTAQRLLYGKNYGTGQMFADQSSDDDMSDVPRTGDMDFWTETELMRFEDDFGFLANTPKLDLLQGHVVTDFGGELSLYTGVEDVSAHTYVSLPAIMKRSIATPLLTQISVVNENVLNYFLCDLEIGKQFESLRRYMLMEDGEFSQSLSDQLFEKLSKRPLVHEMFNPLDLNAVLKTALQMSLRGNIDNPDLSFAVRELPKVLDFKSPHALDCLELTYRVDWPVNLVITDECLRLYAQVFTFMLQLKRQVWTLSDIWARLKRDSTIHKASDGAQFRQLQLIKHEMQHVIKVLQGYIANQVILVTWQEFQHDLHSSVTSLDELMARHAQYLKTCRARCLLNERAKGVMRIIYEIFGYILKFWMQLSSDTWRRDKQTGEVYHPRFQQMYSTYRSFQDSTSFLFKVVRLLAMKGYQAHLQELVLRLNFNGYYQAQA